MLKRDSFYDEGSEDNEEEDSVCEPEWEDVPLPVKKPPAAAAAKAAIEVVSNNNDAEPLPSPDELSSFDDDDDKKMPAKTTTGMKKDPESSDAMLKIAATNGIGKTVGAISSNIDTIDMDIAAKSQARSSMLAGATIVPSASTTNTASNDNVPVDQDTAALYRARQFPPSSIPGVINSSTAPVADTPPPTPLPLPVVVHQIESQISVLTNLDNSNNQNAPVDYGDGGAEAATEEDELLPETEWLPGDDYLPGDDFFDDNNNNGNLEFVDGNNNQQNNPTEGDNLDQALLAITINPVLEGDVIIEEDTKKERKLVVRNTCICLVCFIIISVSIAVPVTIQLYTRETEIPTSMPSSMPSYMPSSAPTTETFQLYTEALYPMYDGNIDVFDNPSSPQYKALYWLYYEDIYTTIANLNFTQRYILAVFYYSTNGDESWLHCRKGDPVCKDGKISYLDYNSDECSWYGNFCSNGDWKVSILNFVTSEGMNMSGTIPDEISHLSSLEGIYIMNNPLLIGTIPSTIGKLTNLTRLQLYSNNLVSPIPKSLKNLENLIIFSIWDNWFDDKIPSLLGKILSLEKLRLHGNLFSGTIPKQIGDLKALKNLDLSQNQLTGQIPEKIYDLKNLSEIRLSYNSLSGTISTKIGQLSQLESFKVANNLITGSLPDTLSGNDELKELDIKNNKLDGTIVRIGDLTKLISLDCSGNQFTGTVPEELGFLPDINEIRLDHNNISGSMPQYVCELSDLEFLTADCISEVECDYPDCCTECF